MDCLKKEVAMVDFNIFKGVLQTMTKDRRITVWHIGTMLGIIQLADGNSIDAAIYISRSKVMALGHINNIVTYHKCIKELIEFGYISYSPSYHPGVRSEIYLLKSDVIL
jgi:hypothetical protein